MTRSSIRLRSLSRAVLWALGLSCLLAASANAVFLGLSTRLGGSGADSIRDVTTDAAGNLYVTGSTTSTDFAGLVTSPNGTDVFVAKLDPSGQRILYLELFGGDGFEEAWAIEVDAAGNAHVAGYTASSTFPTRSGYDAVVDGTDLFLLKLDPNGDLLYGTVYGGPDADGEFNGGIGIHGPSGRVYVGSRADSTGLPTVNAFSPFCPAAPCAFIVGFDPAQSGNASLVYASYVTAPSAVANQEDGGLLDLDVDASENLYAFGFVNPNAQVVLAGQGFQDASGDPNNNDHVLVKLDPSQSGAAQRVYSTFIGGFGDESERGRIAALDSGIIFVGSKTDSDAATFPVLNALQPTNAGGEDGYVAKIDTTIAGAGSQLFTTFLGSVQNDEIHAIAVDGAGEPWVAATVGGDAAVLFPQVQPLPGSPRAGEDDDAVVAWLAGDGSAIRFSSPTAAGGASSLQGLVVQPSGRVVVAGSRADANFPRRGGLPLAAEGGSEIALVGLDPTGDLGLVLEARATADPARTGDLFAFEYLIRNLGSADAANAVLTTDFPVGLVSPLASASCSLPGSSATCELFEDIPRGGDTPLYILGTAAADGRYEVNASVSSDLLDPSPADDDDSAAVDTTPGGGPAADLVIADFDAVAPAEDVGGFALDTADGVLATPNGSMGDVVNLLHSGGALPFHVDRLLGQGEVAFGFVDDASWTPSPGDQSDLFGRDFNAVADRVFAIVDAAGRVELRSARAFDAGRVVDAGFVPLGRPGRLSLQLSASTAEVLFEGVVVASGDPFTADLRDARAAEIGNDFVISVGFGTEDRGAAVLNVPEPAVGLALALGGLTLAAGRRGGRGRVRRASACLR